MGHLYRLTTALDARSTPRITPRATAALLALAVPACTSSTLVAPHQPYAPLLDHAGQLDVAVSAGNTSTTVAALSARAAYAPVDQLEVLARVDADWSLPDDPTEHVGGGVAVGWFAHEPVTRAELIVGVDAGDARGRGARCAVATVDACESTEHLATHGVYVQPFLQGFIGFEVPHFELALGGRLWGFHASSEARTASGSTEPIEHGLLAIDPLLTVRMPFELVRLELMSGVSLPLVGSGPQLGGVIEQFGSAFITVGVAVQLDTQPSPRAAVPPPPT